MVRPITIRITAPMVDADTMILPQYSGFDIQVSRRGIGPLEEDDYTELPEGGFSLTSGVKFILNEVYTVSPLPESLPQGTSEPYPLMQYPHRMVITLVSDSAQDAQGNWIQGSMTVTERICRAEPSSSGRYLNGADGEKIYFDFILYMPLPADTIPPGAEIQVYNADDELMVNGNLKRFNRGQLNARAWV